MTVSEELEVAVQRAEDAGRAVYVQRHEEYDIIEYIEIDGVETYNEEFDDEVRERYWLEDSYRVADRYWRD